MFRSNLFLEWRHVMRAARRFGFSMIVLGALAFCSVVRGGITFLDHFNDASSWNINPANGDYAAGTGIATPVGSVSHGTGFFPGSSPTNGAFSASSGQNDLQFPSYDGN